ncbi:MAG: FAD-dependent oxidoreductase [Lentisphaeria bacterium]|nr:FAD-dependent oxidoreductase [Lentisphaeria bacterium]
MNDDVMIEPARSLPVFAEVDVVVVGGGIAGVSAAVAAARNGVSVCLLEKECSLGGLATLGNVIIYLPLCDGRGNQVIGGIGEELLKLSIQNNTQPIPGMRVDHRIPEGWEPGGDSEERLKHRYRVGFNPVDFMMEIERWILQNKVDLWYDTRFCDVVREGRTIRAVIVENKSGRGAIRCKSVIDASGDADVCARAGEPTESLSTNVRCAWYYYLEDGEVRLHSFSSRFNQDGTLAEDSGATHAGDVGRDVTDHVTGSRRLVHKLIHDRAEASETGAVHPILIPTIPSFRMTRRLRGEIELEMDHEREWFDDCVGMTGDWRKPGLVFYIPLRTLAGVANDNLLAAGRCMSATGSAWDMARVIPTCAVTGEGAGTAAAEMVLSGNTSIGDIHLEALQERLRAQKVHIDRSFADERESNIIG